MVSIIGIPILLLLMRRIPTGSYGVMERWNGDICILPPGHHWTAVLMAYEIVIYPDNQESVHMGSLTIVLVPSGKIGLSTRDGTPVMLLPGGRHVIDDPLFTFTAN